ncbi:MAG: D-alanyl-D-alanine carboxypeptidase family protein [Coriobacteriales bacterium]|nr:D-alanyl-D-alanine carboxypeptidase family protein [Coriobacteriales bacterium]
MSTGRKRALAKLILSCVALCLLAFVCVAPRAARAEEAPAAAQEPAAPENAATPEAAAPAPEQNQAATPETAAPEAAAPAPEQNQPVLSEAKGAVLLDSGGNVLFGYNELDQLPPASITKVMTAVVALEQGPSLDTMVTTVAPDLGGDSQMADYGDGDQVRLGELMQVMLVYSANDAAYNTACVVAGSEPAFVERMNAKAAELGMTHTHFVNSHGLEEDGHYTCALDYARLVRYAMENHPFIGQTALLHYISTTTHGYEVVLKSTNRLLDTLYGVRGVKTGAIDNHYTFVGACGRGDVQLYTAVLGCSTYMGRFNDTESLMEWGFTQFSPATLSRAAGQQKSYPYAFDLGLSVSLVEQSGAQGSLSPVAGDLTYESHLPQAGSLLAANSSCGYDSWSQTGRHVGTSYYATTPTLTRSSAWTPFTKPLFAGA